MISSELEESPLLKVPSFEVGEREITFKNFKLDDSLSLRYNTFQLNAFEEVNASLKQRFLFSRI